MVDVIPNIFNEAPTEYLSTNADGTMRTPLEVMIGIHRRRALIQLMGDVLSSWASCCMEIHNAECLANTAVLSESVADLQSDVREIIDGRCESEIDAHNQVKNIVASNFVVGHLELICKPTKQFYKLAFSWTSPGSVVAAKRPAILVMQDLITHKKETVRMTQTCKYDG